MNDVKNMFGGAGTVFGGAGTINPVPTFNVAQQFGLQGGMADLINSLVQGIVPQMFGTPNMQFGQFGPQLNLYDQFKQRSQFQMQQDAVRRGSQLDQGTYQQMFRGFANLTGTPFGLREQAAASNMSGDLAAFMPFLVQAAPDLVDRMHGSRGSAAVMAQRMALGSRYMADPGTGNIGMTGQSLKNITERVFDRLYGEKADITEMRGVTAGQAGSMFDEMARRGLIGSSPRTLTELSQAKNAKGELIAGGKTTDELMKMPDFGTKVQQFEADRIVDKLKSMSEAVAAMKDIFGENGRADAPMSEIFNALQKVTQNNLSTMQPAQIKNLVRNANNAARMTGMGLEGMMANIAAAGGATDRFGLDRSFSTGVATNSALFASSFGSVFGNVRGFGFMDKERAMGMSRELGAAALGSTSANSLAAMMRLAETGTINLNDPKNAELASYINRIKQGESVEFKGSREIRNLMTKAGVSNEIFEQFARQKTTNQATISQFGLGNIAEKGQVSSASAVIQRSYRSAFGAPSFGLDQKGQAEMLSIISRRLTNATADELEKYTNGDSSFMAEELSAKYQQLTGKRMDPAQMNVALSRGRGTLDTMAARSGYGNAGNFTAMASVRLREQQEQSRKVVQAETDMQNAMAKIGRAGPTQRLADILINGTKDKSFGDVMREAFGGISDEQIRSATGGANGIDKILKQGDLIANRYASQDAALLSKKLNSTQPLTKEEEEKIEAIKTAYGITDLSKLKDKNGKPLSEKDLLNKLTVNKFNTQRDLITKMGSAVKALGLDTATSNISQAQYNAVQNAGQSNSANAGSMAMSLADAIISDSGAMSTLTKDKGSELTNRLRRTGSLADKLANGTLTDEGQQKAANDATIVAQRKRLGEFISNKGVIDRELETIAKDAGVSVSELRGNIVASEKDREELRKSGLMGKLAAAKQAIKDAGDDPVKKKAAQEQYNNVVRQIRAHAQDKGYSADSVIDDNFVSKIKGGLGRSEFVRERLDYQDKMQKGINSQLGLVEEQAKSLGISLSDALGKTLGDDTKAALTASISEQVASLSETAKRGNMVVSDEDKKKLEAKIKRQSEIVANPGEVLKKLLDGSGGRNASVTQEIADSMNKGSANTKAVLARNVTDLEQLIGKNEASGQMGIDFEKIKRIAGGQEKLEDQSPEIQRIMKGMDKEFKDALASGDFSEVGKNIDKAQKEKSDKEAADKATMVRLAPGTKFEGTLDVTSGGTRMVIVPAPST